MRDQIISNIITDASDTLRPIRSTLEVALVGHFITVKSMSEPGQRIWFVASGNNSWRDMDDDSSAASIDSDTGSDVDPGTISFTEHVARNFANMSRALLTWTVEDCLPIVNDPSLIINSPSLIMLKAKLLIR